MKYIPLEDVLGEEQRYVADAVRALEVQIKAVRHDKATDTCFEKAAILGWPARRIVKAVFLHDEDKMYGFVFPELGTDKPVYLSSKEVLPRILDITRSQAKSYRNGICPSGMEFGTCTPFVPERELETPDARLKQIFIHHLPSLEAELVDISIGGFGPEAHKTSVHLPYGAIHDILRYRFREKIRTEPLI